MINIQNKFGRRELDLKTSLKLFQERLSLSRDISQSGEKKKLIERLLKLDCVHESL